METTPKLKGHRAVITGASSGIGREYAKILASQGADLVIAARRLDRLEDLASALRKQYGVEVECCQIDLGTPRASQALFDFSTKNGKEVTILINNAGLGRYGMFTEFPYDDHQSTIQINTVAPTEATYLFAKHMLKHGKPSYITQVASVAAFQPVGNFTVYSGTKGYMMYFSECLSYELRNTNVHVMCLCPGGTYTEFFEFSGQKLTTSGRRTMMSAEEVARSAIKAMFKGSVIYVPGFLNKLACFLPRLVPRSLGLSLAVRIMGKAVEKTTPAGT